MKLLQLISSRVRQYWVNHRLIFILFLIGGILSSVMFSYFYGNMLAYIGDRTSEEQSFRWYSVEGAVSDLPTEEELDSVMDRLETLRRDPLVESVRLVFRFKTYPTWEETIEDAHNMFVDEIMAEVGNVYQYPHLLVLGDTDFESCPNGVILPEGSSGTVGDTIVIAGTELTAIGKDRSDAYTVSFETFREWKIPVDSITVISANRHDPNNDPLKALLEELFPECGIGAPDTASTAATREFVPILTIICAVYGASMLAYMFLLRYLMDANLNTTVVSRIVGAGKWQILGICFGEAVALCALVDGAGIGFHALLYDSVFSKLNKQAGMVYLPEDYLWIFLAMLGVGMVVALGFVAKYASLSPAASRRHTE